MGFGFFIHSILFGIALAMDAFSVSLANGLNQPCMKKGKTCAVAGVFSFFQFIMPLIGWVCVHTVAQRFTQFQAYIPYIALVLLLFIGGKMIYESVKCKEEECCCGNRLTLWVLIMQGVATSIDALSVGFHIADYDHIKALVCCLLIGIVTFFICLAGLLLGKKAGTRLSNKANVLGGIILIFIGIEIFVSSLI